VVERTLRGGDAAYKVLTMAHHVTLRMTLSATWPHNADFAGDKMNLHVPQSEQAHTQPLELCSEREFIVFAFAGE